MWREPVVYPGILFRGPTNSVEDSGQTERVSGCGGPILRVSTKFANE
jgi:hypothetical protein